MSGFSTEAVFFLLVLGAVTASTFISLLFKLGGVRSLQGLLYIEGALDIVFTFTIVTVTSSTAGLIMGVFAGFAFTIMISVLRLVIGTRGVRVFPAINWLLLQAEGVDVPFEATVTHERGLLDFTEENKEVTRQREVVLQEMQDELLERSKRTRERLNALR